MNAEETAKTLRHLINQGAVLEQALRQRAAAYESGSNQMHLTNTKYLAVKAKLDIHRADLQLLQYQLDKILLAVGQPTATPATPGEPSSRVIFSQLRLSVLPAALTDGTFNNIRELSLSHNVLASLLTVDVLGSLAPSLERLDLSFNLITTVPAALSKLTKLKFLSLQSNSIETLESGWSSDLNALETLDLSFNRLLTSSFGSHDLANAGRLRDLSLAHNQLDQVPVFVYEITNLVRLYLDHNRLLQVPSELASLTHLQWLQLNNNKITSSGIHADLLSLPSLVGIGLAHNLLSTKIDFPPNLRLIHVEGNQFTSVIAA